MTIGIVINIPDAVILMADGRITTPLNGGSIIDDDVDKIAIINNESAVIEFGVCQVTERAIEQLRGLSSNTLDINKHVQSIVESLDVGWGWLTRNLSNDVDRSHPAMRAALVAGGFAGPISISTGVLRSFGTNQEPLVITAFYGHIVLGGEVQGAQDYFATKIRNVVRDFGSITDGYNHLVCQKVLDAMGKTILASSVGDSTIGGTIRYVILRQGFLPTKDIWCE